MVGVAQSVELWIVAPAVAGSNPVAHPIFFHVKGEVAPTVDTLLKIAAACQINPQELLPEEVLLSNNK